VKLRPSVHNGAVLLRLQWCYHAGYREGEDRKRWLIIHLKASANRYRNYLEFWKLIRLERHALNDLKESLTWPLSFDLLFGLTRMLSKYPWIHFLMEKPLQHRRLGAFVEVCQGWRDLLLERFSDVVLSWLPVAAGGAMHMVRASPVESRKHPLNDVGLSDWEVSRLEDVALQPRLRNAAPNLFLH
jgi:hypothetical protein